MSESSSHHAIEPPSGGMASPRFNPRNPQTRAAMVLARLLRQLFDFTPHLGG
jgi:hypothetical protein